MSTSGFRTIALIPLVAGVALLISSVALAQEGMPGKFLSRLQKLELSTQQQAQLKTLQNETVKKLESLRSDKESRSGPEQRKKLEAILLEARQQAMKILTPQQRQTLRLQRQQGQGPATRPGKATLTKPNGTKAKQQGKEKKNNNKSGTKNNKTATKSKKAGSSKRPAKPDPIAPFRGPRPEPDLELFRELSMPPPQPPSASSDLNPKGKKLVSPFEQSEQVLNGPRKTKLDQIVLRTLKAKGIEPAPLCSDEVFIRRVYLDVIGVLPTPREVLTFLRDDRPDKRTCLIDSLLERPEFADYWAMKWSDTLRVKAEFPINLWPNGVAAYHRWIHEAIQENTPYDEFARAMLTASGSNFRDPPANFYRAVKQRDAGSLADAMALTFMGTRLANWPKGRRDELDLFFSRVAYKSTDEWKEEIVYWDARPLERFTATMPDGKRVTIARDQDPRQAFADWLITADNPWFARNIANRVWFWLLGRGIVHQPDDFRDDNPASNPELLDYLAKQLVESNYDLRRLYRLILTSQTYQRSSIPHNDHPQAEALFASYPMRPMDAEVLQDAFCKIFNAEVGYSSEIPEPFTYVPQQYRTVTLADGSITSSFLQLFGRPTRDTGLESDRNMDVTKSQRMFFINSTLLNTWITKSPTIRALSWRVNDRTGPVAVRLVWLTFLSRFPTAAEMDRVEQLFTTNRNKQEAIQDLVWTLVNTKEFWCRH